MALTKGLVLSYPVFPNSLLVEFKIGHQTLLFFPSPCPLTNIKVHSVILVNGQFPGPLLEANWGDTIQVTVRNKMKNEGATVHWHGMLQNGTPWMDGVPGGSQCPIAPGSSFVYKFTVRMPFAL